MLSLCLRFFAGLILSLSLSFIGTAAFAQDDDFFEIEEPEDFIEPIPEPYYEEDFGDFDPSEAPPPPPPPPTFRDSAPARPSFQGGSSGPRAPRASSGPVEFELVDPPKYWVGDKKPPLKPPPPRRR